MVPPIAHVSVPDRHADLYLTQARHWPLWHPATVAVDGVTDRPLTVGDQVREQASIGGRSHEAVWTVSEHTRPERLVLQIDGGRIQIAYAFAQVEQHILLRRVLDYRPQDFAGGDTDPVALETRMYDQSLEALQHLKRVVELFVPLERNKLAARRTLERAFNERDFAALDDGFTPDADIPRSWSGFPWSCSLRRGLEGLLKAFPDFHFTVEDQLAEGDRVVIRYRGQGTHRGSFSASRPAADTSTTPACCSCDWRAAASPRSGPIQISSASCDNSERQSAARIDMSCEVSFRVDPAQFVEAKSWPPGLDNARGGRHAAQQQPERLVIGVPISGPELLVWTCAARQVSEQQLQELVEEALPLRFAETGRGKLTDEVLERARDEVRTICSSGLADLLLFSYEVGRWCVERGIPIAARGSATSSLVVMGARAVRHLPDRPRPRRPHVRPRGLRVLRPQGGGWQRCGDPLRPRRGALQRRPVDLRGAGDARLAAGPDRLRQHERRQHVRHRRQQDVRLPRRQRLGDLYLRQ